MSNLKKVYEHFDKEALVGECIRAYFLIKNLQAYVTQKEFEDLYDKTMQEIKKCEAKGDYTITKNFKGD